MNNKKVMFGVLFLVLAVMFSFSVSARKTAFTTNVVTSSIDGAQYVYAADINGDFSIDVAVAGLYRDEVSWLENSGDNINYARHVLSNSSAVCDNPYEIMVVDLDEDGYKDVVVSCYGNGSIAWYRNDGAENFNVNYIIRNINAPRDIDVADLDKDGDYDIMVAAYGNQSVFWYENNGAEVFTFHLVYHSAGKSFYNVKAADLEGDRDYDMVSSEIASDNIYKHVNNGSMSFTTTSISTSCNSPRDIAVGHLNVDNATDIAAVCYGSDIARAYINNGSNTFTTYTVATDILSPTSIYMADVDYDNDQDIIAGSLTYDYVDWYENVNGLGTSWSKHYLNYDLNGAADIFAADMDYDGDSEVYVAALDDDTVTIFENIPSEMTNLKDWNMTWYDIWDDFAYSNQYVNNGYPFPWVYSTSNCYTTNSNRPLLSPFTSNAFGYHNTSTTDPSVCSVYIERNASYPLSGNIVLIYNYSYVNDSRDKGYFDIILSNQRRAASPSVALFHGTVRATVSDGNAFEANLASGDSCIIDGVTNTLGYKGFFIAEFNLTSGEYSWWVNGTASNCYKNKFNGFSSIGGLRVGISVGGASNTFEVYGDDVGLGNGWVTTSNCYDQDGDNYLAKSYVTESGIEYYDECVGGMLQEQVCVNDVASVVGLNCTSIGYSYCSDGACSDMFVNVSTVVNCTDSDGMDYYVKGNVTYNGTVYADYCRRDLAGGCSRDVVEYRCLGDMPVPITKDCSEFGADYSCYAGACVVRNDKPTIQSIIDFDNDWASWYWYLPNVNITYNVSASDPDCDAVYYSVDCNRNDSVIVTPWQFDANTSFCNYVSVGNYTARIYVTDFAHLDYLSYLDYNISVRNCRSTSQCAVGQACNNGFCGGISNVTWCNDTDGGVDADVFGTITTSAGVSRNDSCANLYSVNEYYCDLGEVGFGYAYTPIECDPVLKYCSNGVCINKTGMIELNLNVKDVDTNSPLYGIDYVLEDLDDPTYSYLGTIGDYVLLPIRGGDYYSLYLSDSADKYKSYWNPSFLQLTSSYDAKLKAHCTGTCVFTDDFEYAVSPMYLGWMSDYPYRIIHDSTYGYELGVLMNESLNPITADFPASTGSVVTMTYDVTMANAVSANGQELWVYASHDGSYIVLFKYVVDNVYGNRLFYWTTDWTELGQRSIYFADKPFRTKVIIDYRTGRFDLYLDKDRNGNFVQYLDDITLVTNVSVSTFGVQPAASPYARVAYIDNVDISQGAVNTAAGETESGSLTNPSSSDTESLWYVDGDGVTRFDRTKCAGQKSFIWCAVSKTGIRYLAGGISWVFTGTHIIFFIVLLMLIVIIGPLVVEVFRPKQEK